MLLIVGFAMVFPLLFLVGSSLKPLDELFRFPPPVWPQHPTTDNFSDLFVTMGQSWVPFSRYLVNTVFITFVGTFGHLVIASMAAFVLAKYEFPGGKMFFGVVTTCLMFSGYVTGIPNYLIMSRLGMIDTYWALILPAFAAPIGLFLMKQFMEGLPTALIEAAHIDGAGRIPDLLEHRDAQREARLADDDHLQRAEPVEHQRGHGDLFRGQEDPGLRPAADSGGRYRPDRPGGRGQRDHRGGSDSDFRLQPEPDPGNHGFLRHQGLSGREKENEKGGKIE